MKVNKKSPLGGKVWSSIARFQRKARMSTILEGGKPEGAGAQVTVTEGLALHIIATLRSATVKQVAEVLHLERSWVSRLITSLEQKGALSSASVPEDRRAKGIALSRAGETILRDLNRARGALMARLLTSLKDAELRELVAGLKALADGFNAPDYPPSFDPHPADFQLARLSWAIGVAGNNFIGTGLNVNQYHLLMAAADDLQGQGATVSELHALLPVDMSTLSRTIDGFAQQGLLTKTQRASDKRHFSVELTQRGRARYNELQALAGERCEAALKALPSTAKESFAALLERIAVDIPHRSTKAAPQRLRLVAQPESLETNRAPVATPRIRRKAARGDDATPAQQFAITDGDRHLGTVSFSPAGPDAPLRLSLTAEALSIHQCLDLLKTLSD